MRPISPPIRTDRGGEAGFTLLEIVCVVAIVAMLAAILLPLAPRATSRPRLEAYAVEVATLLKTVLRFWPRATTATMMTTAISATISPYSTAVAPFSERIEVMVLWSLTSALVMK